MKQPTGVNRKFTCNKCGLTKVSRMFSKWKYSKTGYRNECKACWNARTRGYVQGYTDAPIRRSKFVEFMGFVVQGENECHDWTGYRHVKRGRPMFQDKAKRISARWIAEYFWGPAPVDEDGQTYDAHHLCLNDDCVNPAHIRWVSKARHREIHRDLEKAAA